MIRDRSLRDIGGGNAPWAGIGAYMPCHVETGPERPRRTIGVRKKMTTKPVLDSWGMFRPPAAPKPDHPRALDDWGALSVDSRRDTERKGEGQAQPATQSPARP